MKNFNNKLFFIIIIATSSFSNSYAQYKTIEFSVSASPYLDDNMDREFEYKSYFQNPLSHFILGYSFPITPNVLLTPRAGVSSVSAVYRTNNILQSNPNTPSIATSSVVKDKKFFFGHANITASYWLRPNFTGLFFKGELWSIIPISAKSEIYKSTLDASSMQYEEEFINRDIKDQMQEIVPIISIGVGYNLRIFYGFHLFANLNLDYRHTGYFKNTENITHINRRLEIGAKYAFNRIENSKSEN